jgi:hypothetical protein
MEGDSGFNPPGSPEIVVEDRGNHDGIGRNRESQS